MKWKNVCQNVIRWNHGLVDPVNAEAVAPMTGFSRWAVTSVLEIAMQSVEVTRILQCMTASNMSAVFVYWPIAA